MPVKAGFAEIDISPPMGTKKIGWIREIIIDEARDPIFARAAVFDAGEGKIAFVQLDLLCILAEDVAEIRRRIRDACGFPGECVMVSTTHNHAGPAVVGLGEVDRDAAYVKAMIEKIVAVFREALESLREARVGVGSAREWRLSHNRRMVMRDGTVYTHSGYGNPNALYVEGPLDPEVGVWAARDTDGNLLGALVNFACHPTHHGGDTILSAGFPGVLAREMKARGCPVTLFINGAAGNLSSGDPLSGPEDPMEGLGQRLAESSMRAMDGIKWRDDARLDARSVNLALPLREVNDDEIRGTTRGAQRFIDAAIYDRSMPDLVKFLRETGRFDAEVQALSLDEFTFVSVPVELFVQLGLRIKERSFPRRTFVAAFTNGYGGYAPHREAFERGGYETTFSWGSFLGHEAGEILADRAVELVRQVDEGGPG
jgi:hypothetical protein